MPAACPRGLPPGGLSCLQYTATRVTSHWLGTLPSTAAPRSSAVSLPQCGSSHDSLLLLHLLSKPDFLPATPGNSLDVRGLILSLAIRISSVSLVAGGSEGGAHILHVRALHEDLHVIVTRTHPLPSVHPVARFLEEGR
eukprot:scaffold77061_cov75-Phaeocystis_antarctica.AAC.2